MASARTSGIGHTLCDIILSVRAHHTGPCALVTSVLPHTVHDEDAEPRDIRRGAITPGSLPAPAGGWLVVGHGALLARTTTAPPNWLVEVVQVPHDAWPLVFPGPR